MLLLVVVSMMMTMVMMMVAIRRRSITLATQERRHRQFVVELHIRSSGHIHGRGELSKGIGKVESMMLLMLMGTHRRRRSTPRSCHCAEHITKGTVIAWSRAAGSRRIVRMEPLDTIKSLSLERSRRGREEGDCRVAPISESMQGRQLCIMTYS